MIQGTSNFAIFVEPHNTKNLLGYADFLKGANE